MRNSSGQQRGPTWPKAASKWSACIFPLITWPAKRQRSGPSDGRILSSEERRARGREVSQLHLLMGTKSAESPCRD
ncbi:hypothetical protein CHARACLAT_031029 [Characodon lateralis]|uniref:Uncharacterized protein n=1 Tax=Characodon lateralis TaxID=208331 RepID=A0ABU7D235_9TELE|nr:hypothetical protein [Characodon lateralis]